MLTTLSLATLAGALSILSPCVLPLLPVVLASAAAKGTFGPLKLVLGLVISFVAIGLFVSVLGYSIGIDGSFFRFFSAFMLVAIGLLLTLPSLQYRFATVSAPAGDWLDQRVGRGEGMGQFGVGLLLGAVWSPCVGPTLGAASLLASQGRNVGQVALTMLFFALGVALPLLLVGIMSREALLRWRGRMLHGSSMLKFAFGLLLLSSGLLILTGLDKQLESVLVQMSPDWLTMLTTRY